MPAKHLARTKEMRATLHAIRLPQAMGTIEPSSASHAIPLQDTARALRSGQASPAAPPQLTMLTFALTRSTCNPIVAMQTKNNRISRTPALMARRPRPTMLTRRFTRQSTLGTGPHATIMLTNITTPALDTVELNPPMMTHDLPLFRRVALNTHPFRLTMLTAVATLRCTFIAEPHATTPMRAGRTSTHSTLYTHRLRAGNTLIRTDRDSQEHIDDKRAHFTQRPADEIRTTHRT